ncbi:TPA: hypothetical protein ACOEHI_003843 [Enterobacter kobei]
MNVSINFAGIEGVLEFYAESPLDVCEYRLTNEAETVSKADLYSALRASEDLSMMSMWDIGDGESCLLGALLMAIESFGGIVGWPEGWREEFEAAESDLEDAEY